MQLDRFYKDADGSLRHVSGDPHDYSDEVLTTRLFFSLDDAIADMEGELTETANLDRKMIELQGE